VFVGAYTEMIVVWGFVASTILSETTDISLNSEAALYDLVQILPLQLQHLNCSSRQTMLPEGNYQNFRV